MYECVYVCVMCVLAEYGLCYGYVNTTVGVMCGGGVLCPSLAWLLCAVWGGCCVPCGAD